MSVSVFTTFQLVCIAGTSTFTTAPSASIQFAHPTTSSHFIPTPTLLPSSSLITTDTSTILSSVSPLATTTPAAALSAGNPIFTSFPSPTASLGPFDPRNVVLVPITTTLRVFIFPTPKPSPLAGFRPNYSKFPDGSLVTDTFLENNRVTALYDFVIGILLAIFFFTTLQSLAYIRRSRVKKRTLFYTLFASQIFGPICFTTLAIGQFMPRADCSAVNIISAVSVQISYALLITGILGFKAYHVLNRSRLVFIILVVLQALIFVLFAADIPRMVSSRGLAGGCELRRNLKFFPISMILTFVEAFFICVCFCYAVWLSTRRVNRVSYDYGGEMKSSGDGSPALPGRGWWNQTDSQPASGAGPRNGRSGWQVFGARVRSMFSTEPEGSLKRKLSDAVEPLPNRPFVQMGNTENTGVPPTMERPLSIETTRTISGGTARLVQTSRLIFKRVIQDELLSTTLVTATIMVSALIALIGAWKDMQLWGPSIALDALWALVSLLIMRNYARVVHRREEENRMVEERTRYQWKSAALRRRPRTMSSMGFVSGPSSSRRGSEDIVDAEAGGVIADAISWRSTITTDPFAGGPASDSKVNGRTPAPRSVLSWVPPASTFYSSTSMADPTSPLCVREFDISASPFDDGYAPSSKSPAPFEYDEDAPVIRSRNIQSPASVYPRGGKRASVSQPP